MKQIGVAVAALVLGVAAVGYAQSEKFIPARLLAAELASLPATTTVGGGEVLIEAIVDRNGVLTRPIILRGTPPYTQFVFDAIRKWRFTPARTVGLDGVETTVEMPVSIGALYRAPTLLNGPTLGETPKEWSRPSVDVAYPLATALPNYPPNVREAGIVLLEVTVSETGAVTETRSVASKGGYESVSRDALAGWRFRGASHRARPVSSTAYALFGFREPVAPVMFVPEPSKPPYPGDYTPKPPAKPYEPVYTPKAADYSPPKPADFTAKPSDYAPKPADYTPPPPPATP